MKTVNNRTEFLNEVSACLPKDIMAIELGVLNGEFSQMILNILNPRILALVDPFEINEEKYEDGLTTAYSNEVNYNTVFNKFSKEILNKRVSLVKKYSYDVVKECPGREFEFIYIDASHLYEDVKRDLKDWLPKLKQGGIMAGHDYAKISNFGVIQAVDEFCVEHNFEMIILNENGGDWALKSK